MIRIDSEFRGLIPPLSVEELAQLEANLRVEGCRDALVCWGGVLLDGHNRYEICERLGIGYDVRDVELSDRDDAKIWIIRNQFGRRNLIAYDRASLALKLKEFIAAKARVNQGVRTDISQKSAESLKPIDTREEIAKIAGVSHDTISKVETIQEQGTPEQIVRIKSGEASINQVHNEIKHPHVANNSGNNEWYTPSEYVEAAREVMGCIDLDPASSETANKTVKADAYFTREEDGRGMDWFGNVWMNPPYAQPLVSEFCSKLRDSFLGGSVSQACVLVNNATETGWFQGLLEISEAACFIKGRVKYLDVEGNASGAPLQGQAILYMGDNKLLFAERFSSFGIVMVHGR